MTISRRLFQMLRFVLVWTIILGALYPLTVTAIGQTLFSDSANGSLITGDNQILGSRHMGQYNTHMDRMWGRMAPASCAFTTADGQVLYYGSAENPGPNSEALAEQVQQRLEWIMEHSPEMKDIPVPVDLVTSSASGNDPDISLTAARWQLPRLAAQTGKSMAELESILDQCTTNPFLGLFGQKVVNVLQFNLALEGVSD